MVCRGLLGGGRAPRQSKKNGSFAELPEHPNVASQRGAAAPSDVYGSESILVWTHLISSV
jgi:hypothetical protein